MEPTVTDVVAEDHLSALRDAAREQWGNVIRTQIHFNEIIHRTRQLTATLVLAGYGSAAAFFIQKPELQFVTGSASIPKVHVASLFAVLGLLLLMVGYVMDRWYYYRMLIGSVEVGEALEKDYDFPAKLTMALSSKVGRAEAWLAVSGFYLTGVVVGLSLLAFFNLVELSGLKQPGTP